VGDPIEARLNEETARQPAIEQLQKQISLCKSFLSNYDDCYAHITEDERDVLRTEVSKTESWLQTELNKQSKLPKHDNPVLTADAIGKTRATLFKCSSPIMTKPKPAPPAAPQPAAEEKKEKEPAEVGSLPTHHVVSCNALSTHFSHASLFFVFAPPHNARYVRSGQGWGQGRGRRRGQGRRRGRQRQRRQGGGQGRCRPHRVSPHRSTRLRVPPRGLYRK